MNNFLAKRILLVFSPFSTRANEFFQKIRPEIIEICQENNLTIQEIAIENLPYFLAREKISREILDCDLVVAAGGDGISQVAFDALNFSGKNAIFATIPLGHGNDLSFALNKNQKKPRKIFNNKIQELFPLEISLKNAEKNRAENLKNPENNLTKTENFQCKKNIKNHQNENIFYKNEQKIFLASYITFGATTILTDFLNQQSQRQLRKKTKKFSPAFSVPLTKFREISQRISNERFPDFFINERKISDDSVGFFLISAAKNLLRVPKKMQFSRDEFFFHHAKMAEKNLLQKIVAAGIWTTHFPGEIAREKTLIFSQPENFAINIAGDNVVFENVYEISAKRSEKSVKILAQRK